MKATTWTGGICRLAVLLLIGICSPLTGAQVDYFLKIPGVPGEATKEPHVDWINVLSVNMGMQRSVLPLTRESGEFEIQECLVRKPLDFSSPVIAQACSGGASFPEVWIVAQKAGESHDYLMITLTDVLVTSYQTGGSSGDVVPVDTLSLNFGAIKFEYSKSTPEGTKGESTTFEWSTTGQQP